MTARRPKSPDEVDGEIEDLKAHLEALTNGGITADGERILGFEDAAEKAATTEVDWKVAEARHALALIDQAQSKGERPPAEKVRDQRALVTHEDKFRAWKMAVATKESTGKAISTTQSRLEAARTQAANLRAQT